MNAIKAIKQLLPSKNHWPTFLLENRLMSFYEKQAGYRMDISHPQSFTEKLQWYKLYYEGDGHLERIVDKYLFKQYIKEKLGEGYTIPLLGRWTSILDLKKDWDKLPEEFCLKSTLQSDGKFIKFFHKKSQTDFASIENELKDWLNPKKTLINSFCRAYYNATPSIIAEKYMENIKNQLFDYKFFCFNGEPYCIESAKERFNQEDTHFTFYDLKWNKLNVTSGSHPNGDVPHPFHLDDMINLSKVLSKGFPHIRVDFFDTKDKLYIAEMTLYTAGGFSKYEPKSFDKTLGDKFILPKV